MGSATCRKRSLAVRTRWSICARGEFWAVRDVSLEVRRGECVGLIGPNGAGKTTLLKMLNGLIKPDVGRIAMRGRVGALIALGAGFNPILTGRENIFVNGSVLGMKQAEIAKRFDDIVDFADLHEFIDAPVQSYSSGMAVRLGFAVASTLNPDILLVDEVLAVGDYRFSLKCFRRISELLQQGTSVVLVSHQMQTVVNFCTRAVLMSGGQVAARGETEEMVRRYKELLDTDGPAEDEMNHKEIVAKCVMPGPDERLVSGEPCAFDFHCILVTPGESVRCEVTFKDEGGNLLMRERSDWFDIHAPEQCLRLTYDHFPLRTEALTVGVSFWSRDRGLVTWDPKAMRQRLANPDAGLGLVNCPGRWGGGCSHLIMSRCPPEIASLSNVQVLLQERPLVVCDVGARRDAASRWLTLSPHLLVLAFEPDVDECSLIERRFVESAGPQQSIRTFPCGLWDTDDNVSLYRTRKLECSSLYKPNRSLLRRFADVARFDVLEERTIQVSRLDTLCRQSDLPSPDICKLDVQGAELPILRGADELLQECLAIELEVEFCSLYDEQPLFADVDDYLRSQGFTLFDLQTNRWARKLFSPDDAYRNGRQVVWGDAVYFRDLVANPPIGDDLRQTQVRVKGAILAEHYGFPDYAVELLDEANGMPVGFREEFADVRCRWLAEVEARSEAQALPRKRGLATRMLNAIKRRLPS